MFGTPTTSELAAMLKQMERAPGAMSFMVPAVPVMNNPRLNTPWWYEWREMYDDSVVLLLKPPMLVTPVLLNPTTLPNPPTMSFPTALLPTF